MEILAPPKGRCSTYGLHLNTTHTPTTNKETPHHPHIASHRWRYIPVGFYIELILQKDTCMIQEDNDLKEHLERKKESMN
jgi:hypothetical protein